MTVQALQMRTPARSVESLAIALAAGLVLGGLVSLSAFMLARYGPSGSGWSFRGNGALAAYALVPALLAGGWTAVVLRHRRRAWAGPALAAAAVGIALGLIDAALLPVFGSGADQRVGPIVLVALAAWTVVSPSLAVRFPAGAAAPRSVASSIAAGFLWTIGLVGGLVLVGFLIPAGS